MQSIGRITTYGSTWQATARKPEQRFNFMVRSLALPADAFEYGGAGSDMLSRLNTIGSKPARDKGDPERLAKATAIGSLAKRVAAQAAAAKESWQSASNGDKSSR